MQFEIRSHLTAFQGTEVIGSKVNDRKAFMVALSAALEAHDTSRDRAEGQHFVLLPESAWPSVSAGVGRKSNALTKDDFVIRRHRGQYEKFLKREYAAEVEGLACVVYTRDAFLADPDIKEDLAEAARIKKSNCSHVIVAVLAFAGPEAPLTPYRFIHNLAGGNNEVNQWTKDYILEEATKIKAYWDVWSVVAD